MNCTKVSEIVEILESCKANNVTLFKMGNLEVSFKQVSKTQPLLDSTPSQMDIVTEESIVQSQSDLEEEIMVDSKAEELAMLHLSDPSMYEEILANPDLITEFEQELDNKGM